MPCVLRVQGLHPVGIPYQTHGCNQPCYSCTALYFSCLPCTIVYYVSNVMMSKILGIFSHPWSHCMCMSYSTFISLVIELSICIHLQICFFYLFMFSSIFANHCQGIVSFIINIYLCCEHEQGYTTKVIIITKFWGNPRLGTKLLHGFAIADVCVRLLCGKKQL